MVMNTEERTVCVICKSNIYKEIFVDSNYRKIVKCTKCNFVFVLNPDTNTVSLPAKNYVEKAKPQKRHFQIKKFIDSYFNNQKDKINILEIGSGYGALAGLLTCDSNYNYLGFEPSQDRAMFCQSKNLNVKNDFFSSSKTEKVDAVVLDNVLEHVFNPEVLIKEIYLCLNKPGIVIIIVPNLNDIRRFNKKWKNTHYWQPYSHINYFSSKTLSNLLKNNGFQPRVLPLNSINFNFKNLFLILKTLLDLINLHLFGLYYYGIKTDEIL